MQYKQVWTSIFTKFTDGEKMVAQDDTFGINDVKLCFEFNDFNRFLLGCQICAHTHNQGAKKKKQELTIS